MNRPDAGGTQVAAVEGGVDLTMMYAIHDALRRDIARPLAAADGTALPAAWEPRYRRSLLEGL